MVVYQIGLSSFETNNCLVVLKITNSVLYQVRIPSLVIIHLRVGPLSVGTLVLIRIDAVSINFQRPLKNETLSPVNRLFAQKNTVLEIV